MLRCGKCLDDAHQCHGCQVALQPDELSQLIDNAMFAVKDARKLAYKRGHKDDKAFKSWHFLEKAQGNIAAAFLEINKNN